MINTIAAIAAGGAIGALLRHGANSASLLWLGDGFPYGTFMINIIGSFILGVTITLFDTIWSPSDVLKAFLLTGVLSAFTTFSTFSLDVIQLMERQQYMSMSIYYLGSVTLSVISLLLAIQFVKSLVS